MREVDERFVRHQQWTSLRVVDSDPIWSKTMERRVRTTLALDRFVGAGQSTSIARTFTGIGGGFAKRYER
jgi:hypothetical protein